MTYGGFAFWNVVVGRVRRMRPWFAPAALGVSYWHVAYRLYVRFHPAQGEAIEGLYFVRSDCDSRLMAAAGNLVTDYRFHTATVHVQDAPDGVDLVVDSPDAPAHARLSRTGSPSLLLDSPFSSLEEVADRLKYKPFGISFDVERGEANVVRIVRDERAWRSRLVRVLAADWAFFAGRDAHLELCYEVAPIDYQWNRGRRFGARSPVAESREGIKVTATVFTTH